MTRISTHLAAIACMCGLFDACLPAQANDIAQHEQKAREYLQQRQPDLARKEFAIVAEAQPENLDAQGNVGVLFYFDCQYKDAIPHLRAAISLAPQQSKIQARLGLSERCSGDAATARNELAASLGDLTKDKVRRQAGLGLIEMDATAGNFPAAAAAVSGLKSALPTDPEVLYAAYCVYTDLSGEALFELSLAGPDSAQTHQAIAHEPVKARDNAAALTNLRAGIALDPHLPGAHFELTELLAASTSPELKAEAPNQHELAIADNPRDDKPLTRLGELAADRDGHAAAVARYNQALALQPDSADAAIGVAQELVETGRPGAAIPLLLQIVKSDPTNLLAHFRLSDLYRRLHRPDDAKREVAEYENLEATREKIRRVHDSLRNNYPQANDAKN